MITLAYQQLEGRECNANLAVCLRESQIEDLDVFSANADFNVALDPSKKLAYGFELTHNELQSIGYSQNLVVEGNAIVDLEDYMSFHLATQAKRILYHHGRLYRLQMEPRSKKHPECRGSDDQY